MTPFKKISVLSLILDLLSRAVLPMKAAHAAAFASGNYLSA